MSIATSNTWRNKETGERNERTEWHRVVIFNEKITDIIQRCHVSKGTKVYVEGALRTRKWSDHSGKEHYVTEVVVEAFRGAFEIVGSPMNSAHPMAAQHKIHAGSNGSAALEDEISF